MARPKKQAGAPETRDEILRAARLEFAERGIAAPLDAIAARCGIRRSSLLHYYPSKIKLVEAVTDDIVRMAKEHLLTAISRGGGDYANTMRFIVEELRTLEAREQGVGGALLNAMLSEKLDGSLSEKLGEFIDVVLSTVLMAGGAKLAPEAEVRAVLAHLIMGEFTRMAMGERAEKMWGDGDGVVPLFASYFLSLPAGAAGSDSEA